MDWPHLTGWQWGMAFVAACCVGLSKSGFGGFGMLTVLLMAQVLPAKESTGAVLPLLIVADLFAVSAFRKHAVWKHLAGLILPTALGVIAGFLIMPLVPDRGFTPLIGWIILVLVIIQFTRRLRPGAGEVFLGTHPLFAVGVGVLSGVTTMLANAAGAVMTIYLLARRVPKMEFVGTSALFFLMVNLFKVPFSAGLGLITPGSLALNLLLIPGVLIGIWIGRMLLGKIPQRLFEEILLGTTFIAALRMIWV